MNTSATPAGTVEPRVESHDTHHVITGYGTDLAGEAEIGA